MTFESGLDLLRGFGWRTEDYLIFGSGPMAIRGLRSADDIDVVAGPGLFARLATMREVTEHRPGVLHLFIGPLEVLNAWWPFVGEPAEIIARSEIIQGLPFATLDLVLEWKRLSARPKDFRDACMIEDHLAGHVGSRPI